MEKKAYIPGWTISTDSNYTLNYTQPSKFADDGSIADYARQSVYFMNAKGVINGTGNNNCSPTATATRQEAIIIAVHMVEKLKGVTLDYSQSGTTTQPTQPAQPPSGGANTDLVGRWGGAFSGISHYYDFKSDGTYLSRRIEAMNLGPYMWRYRNFYIRGSWYESGGVVYMTNSHLASFEGSDKPPENLNWVDKEDETMRIRFGISDDQNYLGQRIFENLELVYVTPDGSLPDAYCTLIFDNVPDWIFP